jgi:hypothetical protein
MSNRDRSIQRLATSLVATLLASTLAGPLTGTVLAASPGVPVHFTLLRAGADLAEVGWWADGAINDSGEWATPRRIFGGHDGTSNAFVVAIVDTTETSASGSFRIVFHGLANRVHPFDGEWQLSDGTGAYAGIKGHGTWFEGPDLPDGRLDFELNGWVQP